MSRCTKRNKYFWKSANLPSRHREEKYPRPVYHPSASPLPVIKGVSEPQPYVARQGSLPGYRPQTLDPKDLARIRQKIQLDAQKQADQAFQLDAEAPLRAKRADADVESHVKEEAGEDGVVRKDMVSDADVIQPETSLVKEEASRSGEAGAVTGKDAIGTPFKLEWIKVGNLPFHQLKHLRNPWNQDKEVKVSRAGNIVTGK